MRIFLNVLESCSNIAEFSKFPQWEFSTKKTNIFSKMYQIESSRDFQNAPKLSRISKISKRIFELFQNIPEVSKMFERSLEMFQNVIKHSRNFERKLDFLNFFLFGGYCDSTLKKNEIFGSTALLNNITNNICSNY